METGLREARWPGRLEQVLDCPKVMLDVAHNPAGARELAASLDGSARLILALSSDKDGVGMLGALRDSGTQFFLTAYDGPRAMPIEVLRAAAEQVGLREFSISDSIGAAIESALKTATSDDLVVITGSIFTVGEARSYLMAHHGVGPLQF